ncbi:MAG: nuclear transport factor 2 family protein [Marinifilaceae bacterium]
MNNNEVIKKFYTSFSDSNIKGMIECYHKEIVFIDPVFGKLKGERVIKMWEMLLAKKNKGNKISFSNIMASSEKGEANWVAEYIYGEDKRKIVNKISANFKFKEGKIIEHTDYFNLWKWTKQAMGPAGYLLGWSYFMRKQIQEKAKIRLEEFIKKQ